MTAVDRAGGLPNIIFIMADDLGYGDLGCYGATKIPTPHIDRIAAAGLRAQDAHASAALCTPSRYSVLTGRYPWRSPLKEGVLWGFSPPLIEPERLTVAEMLSRQGYATAAIGKWHLGYKWTTTDGTEPEARGDGRTIDYDVPLGGGPLALGFDYSFNIAGSLDMAPYCFIENDRVLEVPTVEKQPYHAQQRPGLMPPGWRDDMVDVTFAEKAVAWIERHAKEQGPERPFFLYLTPSAPHRPHVPPPFITGASASGERGDMIALFDWLAGRVDETLTQLSLQETTLLIVTSDNGAQLTDYYGRDWGHAPNGPWRGQKADIWDGGHREPLIARWPGHIAPGSSTTQLICLGDLFATCAEITGYQPGADEGPDSASLLSILRGVEAPARESLVHQSGDGMRSLRRGPWKLIEALGSGGFTAPARRIPDAGEAPGQLYNLDQDPGELVNRWDEEPALVATLRAELALVCGGS